MANRLWNVLTFTNVAAGASSAATPHLLNRSGTNLEPDFVWCNNPAFSGVATSTTVTVTNNSGGAATVEVLVCAIHSIIRELGGTDIPDLPVKPYWLIGNGAAAGPPSMQVFRRTIVQPADGSDFFVTLPAAMPNDSYSVFPAKAGVVALFDIDCPDIVAGDRLPGSFRVVTAAPPANGDFIDFWVVPR